MAHLIPESMPKIHLKFIRSLHVQVVTLIGRIRVSNGTERPENERSLDH